MQANSITNSSAGGFHRGGILSQFLRSCFHNLRTSTAAQETLTMASSTRVVISKSLESHRAAFIQANVRSTTQRHRSFSHSCGRIFSDMSTRRPSSRSASRTNVPRQPAAEEAVHRLVRREVVRELTPLAARLHEVQHGVRQLALAPLPVTHPRKQRLYRRPLRVRQVRRVRLALLPCFFHACTILIFRYENRLLIGISSQKSVIKRNKGFLSELFPHTVIPRHAMLSFPCPIFINPLTRLLIQESP